MKKSEIQKVVLEELLKTFMPESERQIDWMGNPLTNKNKPTYHHIEKASDLRKKHKDDSASIKNGAILGVKSHRKLNKLETADPELYECWNYLFTVISAMGIYPIEDVWKMIYSLKEKTEEVIYPDSKLKK